MSIDIERAIKKQEVEEKVYRAFIGAVDGCGEDEIRYLGISCAMRILDGMQISLRSKLMGEDLKKQLGGQ